MKCSQFPFFLLAFAAFLVPWPAVAAKRSHVWTRVVLHDDGSKTETRHDSNKRSLHQFTYDSNNVLTMKRVFRLDRRGKALSGVAFDGKSNLLFSMRYIFDKYGRLSEERIFNTKNVIIRRLIHTYDAEGKSKQVAVSYASGKGLPDWYRMIVHPDALEKSGNTKSDSRKRTVSSKSNGAKGRRSSSRNRGRR